MTRRLSFSDAAWIVARREFRERARDRSFAVSTALTVVIIALVLMVPKLIGAEETSYTVTFLGDRAAGVAQAARNHAAVGDVALTVRDFPADVAGQAQARAAVKDGTLDAVVEGGAVTVRRSLDDPLRVVLENAHAGAEVQARLAELGLDQTQAQRVLTVRPMEVRALDADAAQTEARTNIAFIGSLLLYGQLIGYAFWVALGVVEEKSSRVVELLLSAIPARALLAGKVVGIGALGLAQLLLIAVVGLGVAAATDALTLTSALWVPVGLVVAWFVLGYAAYACLAAAAAARVSRQEELQNATTPLTTLALVSFFATFYVRGNGDSTAAQVLAVLPPVSALTMPVRAVSGDAAVWELPVALVLMLVLIVGLILVAGRVYEGAVLRMGAKVSLREAWRG